MVKKILLISFAITLIFFLDFYVNKKRPIKTIVYIILMDNRDSINDEQYGGLHLPEDWGIQKLKKNLDKFHRHNLTVIDYKGFNPKDFTNYFLNELNDKLSINPSKKLNYRTNPTQKYSKLLSTHFHLLLMFDRNLTSKEILIIKNINQEYLKRYNFHYLLNLKTITLND